MGLLLGVTDPEYFKEQPTFARISLTRKKVMEDHGLLPQTTLLNMEEWNDLKFYFMESAPETPISQINKPPLDWSLEQFEFQKPKNRLPKAVSTLVKIRPETNELYVGDSSRNTLTIFDSNGARVSPPRHFSHPITPIDIEFKSNSTYIASIGDLTGANHTSKLGYISEIKTNGGSVYEGKESTLLENLYRIADFEMADLNQDGVEDFIISGFGTSTGALSWFEAQGNGSFIEHTLADRAGALKSETHDFNNDGLLDIAVLMGDAREGFFIFENQGNNEFTQRVVFLKHPGFGHTFFELVDFNTDGLMDLLVVNGDNVDSDPYNTLKNYHGIRIYLNKGNYVFEETYFYPMRGAFIAKSSDFDLDGDIDIAAIAFYPDFNSSKPESFTYLKNNGNLNFNALSNFKTTQGRWMTMDVGDIDGDGDDDIALGGVYAPIGMSKHRDAFDKIASKGPSFLILKNTQN